MLIGAGVGAAWKVAAVEPGSTVAVFGLGAVGLAVTIKDSRLLTFPSYITHSVFYSLSYITHSVFYASPWLFPKLITVCATYGAAGSARVQDAWGKEDHRSRFEPGQV